MNLVISESDGKLKLFVEKLTSLKFPRELVYASSIMNGLFLKEEVRSLSLEGLVEISVFRSKF